MERIETQELTWALCSNYTFREIKKNIPLHDRNCSADDVWPLRRHVVIFSIVSRPTQGAHRAFY
jgi:hypothetical protein